MERLSVVEPSEANHHEDDQEAQNCLGWDQIERCEQGAELFHRGSQSQANKNPKES